MSTRKAKARPPDEPDDVEQAREDLLQFERDFHYFATIYEELKTDHPDGWVSIYRGEVIAIDSSIDRVIDALERRGISPAHAVVQHILPPGLIIAV